MPGAHPNRPPETSRTGCPVEDVEVALRVKGYPAHLAEHLPGLVLKDADVVDLLEIGVKACRHRRLSLSMPMPEPCPRASGSA